MTRSGGLTRFALAILGVWLAGTVLLAGPQAAEAKDYSYIFLQGRIADPSTASPLAAVTVRLQDGSRVFEAETNERGVFVFDRLPVAAYDMTIVTADGKGIHAARELRRDGRDRTLLDVRLGWDEGQALKLEPADGGIEVVVGRSAANWPRFRKQLLVFAGVVGLLAL